MQFGGKRIQLMGAEITSREIKTPSKVTTTIYREKIMVFLEMKMGSLAPKTRLQEATIE